MGAGQRKAHIVRCGYEAVSLVLADVADLYTHVHRTVESRGISQTQQRWTKNDREGGPWGWKTHLGHSTIPHAEQYHGRVTFK